MKGSTMVVCGLLAAAATFGDEAFVIVNDADFVPAAEVFAWREAVAKEGAR